MKSYELLISAILLAFIIGDLNNQDNKLKVIQQEIYDLQAAIHLTHANHQFDGLIG